MKQLFFLFFLLLLLLLLFLNPIANFVMCLLVFGSNFLGNLLFL